MTNDKVDRLDNLLGELDKALEELEATIEAAPHRAYFQEEAATVFVPRERVEEKVKEAVLAKRLLWEKRITVAKLLDLISPDRRVLLLVDDEHIAGSAAALRARLNATALFASVCKLSTDLDCIEIHATTTLKEDENDG